MAARCGLDDFRGKPVVLLLPQGHTPGCTKQACGVRDHEADYAEAGAVVLGISPDTVAKVKKFHDEQSLNFALLADEGHRVADAYGVWVEKSMYGRNYFGNERTTFVIDSGRLRRRRAAQGQAGRARRARARRARADRLTLAIARAAGNL